MKNKNNIYKDNGDYEYTSRKATKTELDKARKEAKKIMADTSFDSFSLRSCWVCNSAHTYFLKGKWGKWILNCFDCGRFYFNKIDITNYE